jgi:DNA polymerase-3 subunit epsilon
MILFKDYETAGLADFNKRASDPSQPHIVKMACMLTTEAGEVMESHNVIIRPDGWSIPKEASDVHGITNEIALEFGIPEAVAISLMWSMIEKSKLMVAHNLMFDKFLSRIAGRRFGLLTDDKDEWWKQLPGFCTMRETTLLCNLPGGRGGQPKWPKLTEAYSHIFGKSFDDAHDAMADVSACKEIYFWLKTKPEQCRVGGAK